MNALSLRQIPVTGAIGILMGKSVRRKLRWLGELARPYHISEVDLSAALPIFVPNSGVPRSSLDDIILEAATDTIPSLVELNRQLGARVVPTISAGEFVASQSKVTSDSEKLGALFDAYGSDKGTVHGYHSIYAALLDSANTQCLVEIGLGTGNDKFPSSMGPDARPGASVRAFRDFLPNAQIVGADVDEDTLFVDSRISTFFVDARNRDSLRQLSELVPDGLDMVIDDGLHSPHTNIRVLGFGLEKVRVGGWVIIEDIGIEKEPIWQLVGGILPEELYSAYLVMCNRARVFAVCRLK